LEEVYALDRHKEELLQNQWFRILRITNDEVEKDIKNVILKIKLLS
jgi:very-short-patch-repair endonuclease